ncbi:helix-turn-helix domain-containing protein [Pelagicoccus enzymogenes]|uniref:helix-turn-helix domain-containing protein n=1 Tax=Pelagicoccus enzymogenes TaxID=2773457 RepID=UPI0031F2E957
MSTFKVFWFTPAEAAAYLRVSERTITRKRQKGKLIAYPIEEGSRHVRYRREDLDALLGYPGDC